MTAAAAPLKVRRAMRGLYALTAGPGLRWELAQSEDSARVWQLVPRSPAAYKLLGEPDVAPKFQGKAQAVAHVRGLLEHVRSTREATP